MAMTSKTATQFTKNRNIDTSDASEFPALAPRKQTELRDDVSISSVSDESVCSRRSVRSITIFDVLEDVGRTTHLQRDIDDEKRRCYEDREIYKGPNKATYKRVVLNKRTCQDALCYKHCDDRLNNKQRLMKSGSQVSLNGFEKFSNGDVWFRLERPFKGWWIPEEAFVGPVHPVVQPGRSRPERVVKSTKATKATSQFVFGETVECFVNDVWRQCEVVSRKPLQVCLDGRTYGNDFPIRKVTGDTFFTIASVPVRSWNDRRFVIRNLDVKTQVEVVAWDGVWAKINKPFVGWIQYRNMEASEFYVRNSATSGMVVTVSNLPQNCDTGAAYNYLRNAFRKNRIYLVGRQGYRIVDCGGERCMEIDLPTHTYAWNQAQVMMYRARVGAIIFEEKTLSIRMGRVDSRNFQHGV